MDKTAVLKRFAGKRTEFKNIYTHKSELFEYIYVDDDCFIEAKNMGDLKFKLSLKKIELQSSKNINSSFKNESSYGEISDAESKQSLKNKQFGTGIYRGNFILNDQRSVDLRNDIFNSVC